MKSPSFKWKKALIIASIAVVSLIIIVIAFISPITKYLVEKYSVKYTGRQIKMSWAYVNPFTGYIHFSNLKIYEYKSDTIFFSAKGLSASIALRKILSKTYEITSLTLDKPWGRVIQSDKNIFNFSDIINKFSSKDSVATPKEPAHFNLLNIKINNGEFHYIDKEIPVNYFIKSTYFESSGKWWNRDTMNVKFSFQSGPNKGDLKGSWTFNFSNASYRLNAIINQLDLKTLEQYLHTMANYGSFTANMDANINATGNFRDASDLDANGLMAINDFHIGKVPGEDYASFDKMLFKVNKLNPKNHIYFFDSLITTHPYFLYERYDYLDNIERMFGENGSNVKAVNSDQSKFNLLIALAQWVQALAKNFFQSDFKINDLAILKGDIRFNDYSLREKFSIDADPLNIVADSIYKNHDRVHLSIKTAIKPYGNALINLSMNPKDYGDFDMTYYLGKLPVPMFNPYTITYTSFPFDRGIMEFDGNWKVRNGIIQSSNHLLIVDPYTDKRLRKKDTKWIPVPLIMAFVRERGGVIDYEVPITGNLKNPEFHLRYVLLDLLKNIFIKPPTIPYGVHVTNVEETVEKSIIVSWQTRESILESSQEKFIKKIAEFLKQNPGVSISVYPFQYTDKEKEYILFYEAKKKYFMLTRGKNSRTFTEDDSLEVDKMSIKDSLFVQYLDKHVADSMMFTVQEKCRNFVDSSLVNARYNQLLKSREIQFLSYFKTPGVESHIKIYPSKDGIPYNGFSYYKINYNNGELPDELKVAYKEMNELNDGWFRKKYKNIRDKFEKPLVGKNMN